MHSAPEKPLDQLKQIYLFSTLSDQQLQQVAQSQVEVRLAANEQLFHQGKPAQHFYIVQSGEIKLYRLSEEGDEKVIEIIKPGQTFAEAAMFMAAKAYPVNAEAIGNTTVIGFQMETFLDVLHGSIDTCFQIMAVMSQRLHRQLNDIDSLTLHNATFRLVNYLLGQLPAGVLESPRIGLTTPKHVIASRLSIQPETFSRLMAKLARDGLLATEGNNIILTDLERLRKLVDLHKTGN